MKYLELQTTIIDYQLLSAMIYSIFQEEIF